MCDRCTLYDRSMYFYTVQIVRFVFFGWVGTIVSGRGRYVRRFIVSGGGMGSE